MSIETFSLYKQVELRFQNNNVMCRIYIYCIQKVYILVALATLRISSVGLRNPLRREDAMHQRLRRQTSIGTGGKLFCLAINGRREKKKHFQPIRNLFFKKTRNKKYTNNATLTDVIASLMLISKFKTKTITVYSNGFHFKKLVFKKNILQL